MRSSCEGPSLTEPVPEEASGRYVCVHGHFYQPPRENPWLETIEVQDSARPYHDWNERVSAQCYAPNAVSRILDGEGRILRIVNNYSRISFNFGPTLLAWLEHQAPDVYQAVLDADQESARAFGGHGSALAQPYNHMIMPLASPRDRRTQAIWGIKDFARRFGRPPEGMWLPETAVDEANLALLAELGIAFTILSPHQARRVRRPGGRWTEIGPGGIDPSMPYLFRAGGRSLAIFFYDGPISRAVAFEGLLESGEGFASRLLDGFSDERGRPQLSHIATDGETYGHHHRHGDMALAYALHQIDSNRLARLTNYGQFLEMHPPTHEVEIVGGSSWSCAHGVERWRSDCGCSTGALPGWNQAWREPLRDALDWLRDEVAPRYEETARALLADPWGARDDYIDVVLDRSSTSREAFLTRHALEKGDGGAEVTTWKLLELQRHAMLMYTSCGWFFDDLSGIETVQVIQYAARVVQLAEELFGESIEPRFLERLREARSNLPEHGDGAAIYERHVRPSMVDLGGVCAHFAVASMFEAIGDASAIHSYRIEGLEGRQMQTGVAKLGVGRARVTSEVTRETAQFAYGAIHFGDHNLNAGVVRSPDGVGAFREMERELTRAFSRADLAEVIRILDRYFGGASYSLKQLFRDERGRVLDQILDSTLAGAEASYRQVYERHAPLMRFLTNMGIELPDAMRTAAAYIIQTDLSRAFSNEPLDSARIWALLEEAEMWRLELDSEGLGYRLQQTMERLADSVQASPTDEALLERLDAVVTLVRTLPIEVNLWRVQNVYYGLMEHLLPAMRARADAGEQQAAIWVGRMAGLGEKLMVRRLPLD